MTKRRGRPAGLLINPPAYRALAGKHPQSLVAGVAEFSTAHLSGMLSGTKGATPEMAERLADALTTLAKLDEPIDAAALFPELTQFRTAVRHFVAPTLEAA